MLATIIGGPLGKHFLCFGECEDHLIKLRVLAMSNNDRPYMILRIGQMIKSRSMQGFLVFFYSIVVIILSK